MSSSTVSDKYQVVITKDLRKSLNIKRGQKVYLTQRNANELVISTMSRVEQIYGTMKGAWGSDSDAFLMAGRQEALRDRT